MSTFLFESLPIAAVGNSGTDISLSTILTDALGANWGGYTQFWLAYDGAAYMTANDFRYWDPNAPNVSKWLDNGTAIKASNTNFNQVSPTASQVSNYTLELGNDIMPYVFLTVPIGNDNSYIQYEINVVAPGLQGTPSGVDGAPTPADIVATAYRYNAAYNGVLNPNDCGFIASDLAAAAGAPLDDAESESLDPTQNNSAGFWRVVYRGSDPNPVSNWQSLLQPGDIVRMGWIGGGQHTTTVLSVNGDGSITVFDNDDSNNGGPTFIGVHTVNYDTETIPTTITIFRLTTDHLYLIDGSSTGQILNGTPMYDNEIITGADTQTVNCGPLDDVVDITAVSTGTMTINGGGGQDTVVFTALGLESVQITGSTGQSLTIANGTLYDLSGGAVTVAWSGGSDTLNNISSIQFTDATLTIETAPAPYDFNANGISDVLWRNSTNESLAIWLMNGSAVTSGASVTSGGSTVAPDSSWSVAGVGDFNGDGDADMLWRQSTTDSLAMWLMNGSAIASSAVVTSGGSAVAPNSSWSVAGIGDFNGDSDADILWRQNSTGALAEWTMNGSAISSSANVTAGGSAVAPDSSWSVAGIGDFNGDGKTDLLWRQSTTGSLAQWLMNGSVITSAAAVTSEGSAVAPNSSWSIVGVGDFNGDGTADLLWRQSTTGSLAMWLMNGSTITSSASVTSGGSAVAPDSTWNIIEVGDFNGSNQAGILWQQSTTGMLSEWQMNGGQIVSSQTVTSAGSPVAPAGNWQVQARPTDFT